METLQKPPILSIFTSVPSLMERDDINKVNLGELNLAPPVFIHFYESFTCLSTEVNKKLAHNFKYEERAVELRQRC